MDILTVQSAVSDTASFMAETGALPEQCLNSIVVSTKKGGEKNHSLILVPATHRLDNKGLKQALGGKTSFMPMDQALELTGMERDSIGPVEAPTELPIIADLDTLRGDKFFVGGGVLGRKYVLNRSELESLVDEQVTGIYAPID